jgi:outer membrane protein assembly factor BamB
MRFLPRGTLGRALLMLTVVIVGVGVAALVIVLDKPGDVSHPDVQFTAPHGTAAATTRPKKRQPAVFSWPWYGLSPTRTRQFVAPADLRPPLHVGWSYHSGALLEFPPSIRGDDMYFLDDSGEAHEMDVRTGKLVWQRHVGALAAASPAIDAPAGVVLMPILSDHGHSPGDGRFVALSMRTGRVRWSHPLPAGSESSPIVHGDSVYFGDGGGTLYALDARTGRVQWTFKASGAIKGGPALWHGNLYFGDYDGRVYAVRAATGHQVWAVSTDGAHFGLGSGNFYATPAIAYGRVFIGNTDGRMYAFGARTGALAWATATGAYVYSSAAVADPRGLGPTVYAGSYDGDFYAFDARTGSVRWRHPAGGKISGSATIVGNVVYYSDLASHTTAGLNVRTGDQVYSFHDGAFTPVVADPQAIFLIGQGSIYQMLPGAAPRRPHRAHPAGAHHRSRAPRARG